eukprot:GEMP01071911.1.p1 GENE.GEMP01071911.1~~GEMP01071911.1.p1  ORF type:complete len:162 (+),score=30.23 GEMP01071911.1:385-870(+)
MAVSFVLEMLGSIAIELALLTGLSRASVFTHAYEKIYNRPTKLCYGEAKRPVRCEHFIVAQEVRKCEEERRKLKYMYRMLELENDNYHPDDKGRSLIFDEIVEAILECDECLEELDTMKDPTDEERKRVFWRKEVAYRRLKTLDEMDFVDERIADQRKMNE